jgi:hypothetical protein
MIRIESLPESHATTGADSCDESDPTRTLGSRRTATTRTGTPLCDRAKNTRQLARNAPQFKKGGGAHVRDTRGRNTRTGRNRKPKK